MLEEIRIFNDFRDSIDIQEEIAFNLGTVDKFKDLVLIDKPKSLESADLMYANLGAEIKRGDFISSIFNGSIFNQAAKLALNFKYGYILLAFEPSSLGSPENIKRAYSVLADAEIRYNIHCRFCMNDEYLIYYFLDLCIKLKNEVKPKWVMRLPDPSITDESMLMFSGIKGLGLKRIKNLFLEFGSPEYIFNATIKELASVDKIGKKTAKHIKDVYYTMIDDIDSNLKIKEIDKVGKW